MEATTQSKRLNHSFRLVKFNGTRIKDYSDSAIKKLAIYNANQTRLPQWDKNRLNRIPDKVEVAARKELKLRGYKIIGLRIETIH
jgi:hypothetical protein